jgi:hypothetical protein
MNTSPSPTNRFKARVAATVAPFVAFVALASVFAFHHTASAQNSASPNASASPAKRPNITVRIAGANASANAAQSSSKAASGEVAADSIRQLQLVERRATILTLDSGFQAGDVVIGSDVEPTTSLIVPYALIYRDARGAVLPNINTQTIPLPAPLPAGAIFPTVGRIPPAQVGINSLQGDLSPTILTDAGVRIPVNTTTTAPFVPNVVTLGPGRRQRFITFTARWSDQTLGTNAIDRNPGLQGQRLVTVVLLPDTLGTSYDLGVTIATVRLDDPVRLPPVIQNAQQDRRLEPGRTETTEIETAGFRSDGKVNSVFYDDNYNILTYTVESSDPSLVTVSVLMNDPRFMGRPTMTYTMSRNAVVGTRVRLTLTANDGFGGLATDSFDVVVTQNVTASVNVTPQETGFTVYPNPTPNYFTLQATAQQSGTARVRVLSPLGATLLESSQSVRRGESYTQNVNLAGAAAGVYFVEVNDGAVRSVQRLVKN